MPDPNQTTVNTAPNGGWREDQRGFTAMSQGKNRISAREAVRNAVNVLTDAGMEIQAISKTGQTYYLQWPGSPGVLRVSDHSGTGRGTLPIWGRLTFPLSAPIIGGEKMTGRIAMALGRYMLKAAGHQRLVFEA